ncbi:hypothetical protein [Nocardia sp. NPDC004711]
MTTFDVRPAGPAADLSADRTGALVAEVQRLTEALAAKDQELTVMARLLDDALDRESMHVYAPDLECLTTAAELERRGTPRATHLAVAGQTGPGKSGLMRRAMAQAFGQQHTLPAPAVEAPDMEWGGFDR